MLGGAPATALAARAIRPNSQHDSGSAPTIAGVDGDDADVGEEAQGIAGAVAGAGARLRRHDHASSVTSITVRSASAASCRRRRDVGVQIGQALAGAGAALDQRRLLELRQVGRGQLGVELRDLQAGAGDALLERVGALLQVADVDLRAGQAAERREPVRRVLHALDRHLRDDLGPGRRCPPASRTGR